MDLLKLLPIFFIVAQGEGRAVEHPQQLLPVIPGYVPVYIQQGPDVEVIYEAGRKAVVAVQEVKEPGKEEKDPAVPAEEDTLTPEQAIAAEEAAKRKGEMVEEEMKKKKEDKKKEEMLMEGKPTNEKVEGKPSGSPSLGAHQNSISERDEEEDDQGSRGVGTVQEVGRYQEKLR